MQPLTDEVKADWKRRSCDWVKFHRQLKSNWRCWINYWFGKDWLFYLWMIFGEVNEDMMKCFNDICRKRCAENDPASPRAEIKNLSERNRAIELGVMPIPAVKGIQHTMSIPLLARIAARKGER